MYCRCPESQVCCKEASHLPCHFRCMRIAAPAGCKSCHLLAQKGTTLILGWNSSNAVAATTTRRRRRRYWVIRIRQNLIACFESCKHSLLAFNRKGVEYSLAWNKDADSTEDVWLVHEDTMDRLRAQPNFVTAQQRLADAQGQQCAQPQRVHSVYVDVMKQNSAYIYIYEYLRNRIE